jgi:hypothetical protein
LRGTLVRLRDSRIGGRDLRHDKRLAQLRCGLHRHRRDLIDRKFGVGGVDFLTDWTPRHTIITNPPSVAVPRQMFQENLSLIAQLRAPPVPV